MTSTQSKLAVHDEQIKELKDGYLKLQASVDQMLQVMFPEMKATLSSIRTEVRIMAALNFTSLIVGIFVSKLLFK